MASNDAATSCLPGRAPRSASTVVSAAAQRRKAGRPPGSGRVGYRAQVASARSRSAAASAISSRSATTPRKLPSRTTVSTPGQCERRRRIKGGERRAAARGTDDPAVAQAVRRQVVHEAGPTGELVRQVEPGHTGADDVVGGGGLGLILAAGSPVEQHIVGEFPVTGGPAVRCQDLAVGHGQLALRYAEPGRGDSQVEHPGLRAHQADGRARVLDGQAARGIALIGAGTGGRGDHPHPGDADVQFLGGHLGQRGEYALPEFHLSRPYLNNTRAQHAEPVTEAGVHRHQGRQRDGPRRRVHAASPRSSAAAASTARTMRLCAPHRHRLRSRAARTSASDGSSLRLSSSTAAIVTPDMQ